MKNKKNWFWVSTEDIRKVREFVFEMEKEDNDGRESLNKKLRKTTHKSLKL